MKSRALKRTFYSFICLLGAFLIVTVGCHAKKTEKSETKESEIAKDVHIITSPDDLESVFSSEIPPQQVVKQVKDLAINTILPLTSGKNKEKLNKTIKYLNDTENKPSDYFDDMNNIIDLIQTMAQLTVIAAETEPDDFYVNYKAAVHCVSAGNMIEHLAQSEKHKQLSAEYKKKGVQASKVLVERFPGEAKGYAQFAFSVIVAEGDKKKAMELYKRCSEIDPELEYCKKNYDDLREELNK